MFVLDTDIFTHLLLGHRRVTERMARATAEVTLTIVTRIEVLQGRFASVLKAEHGEQLTWAYPRLVETEKDLHRFLILPFDGTAASEFDRLRQTKKLRIGRCDCWSPPSPSRTEPRWLQEIRKTSARYPVCGLKTGPIDTTNGDYRVPPSFTDRTTLRAARRRMRQYLQGVEKN
jgi:tRNA(fMet)-specific endonuclease VapC